MTDWLPMAKFKKRKGEWYLFYHPKEEGGLVREGRDVWVTADHKKPSYPRQPTLYAVIALPTTGIEDHPTKGE